MLRRVVNGVYSYPVIGIPPIDNQARLLGGLVVSQLKSGLRLGSGSTSSSGLSSASSSAYGTAVSARCKGVPSETADGLSVTCSSMA